MQCKENSWTRRCHLQDIKLQIIFLKEAQGKTNQQRKTRNKPIEYELITHIRESLKANKYVKRCPTWLLIREIQTIMKGNFYLQ